jgi:NitT/TauT family transport system ATP-binding protein
MAENNLIEIQHLYKKYAATDDNLNVLSDINLHIREGEFHILLGPSGCGKSTLLNIVAGLLKKSSGKVTLNGKSIRQADRDRGVVFQNADKAIYPWLTVYENVEYGLKMNRVSKSERKPIVEHYLELVGLTEHKDKYPGELSGGMKQRTQIARVLANNPEVLIMDEPFGALDAQTRHVMQKELIHIWKETGKTIIFVTHDIQEAILLGTDISIMSKSPDAKIYQSYKVDFAYPRDETSPRFNELYRKISEHFVEKKETDLKIAI